MENFATVIVADGQLSLAIGKEGQNARLAARLTSWKIDIKNASLARAEQAQKALQEPIETVEIEGQPETAIQVEGGTPLEQLGLSTRTFQAIVNAGISTVDQLQQKTDQELLGIRNFGQKSLEEIRARLADFQEPRIAEEVTEEKTLYETVVPVDKVSEPVEEITLPEEISTTDQPEQIEEAEDVVLYEAPVKEEKVDGKPVIRFAEDIFERAVKSESKKKGKKKSHREESDLQSAKRRRKIQDSPGTEYEDLLE
jgi:hypothetical protein